MSDLDTAAMNYLERADVKARPGAQVFSHLLVNAFRAGAAYQRVVDAKLCQDDAAIHRENDETTWAALAESLAERILNTTFVHTQHAEKDGK